MNNDERQWNGVDENLRFNPNICLILKYFMSYLHWPVIFRKRKNIHLYLFVTNFIPNTFLKFNQIYTHTVNQFFSFICTNRAANIKHKRCYTMINRFLNISLLRNKKKTIIFKWLFKYFIKRKLSRMHASIMFVVLIWIWKKELIYTKAAWTFTISISSSS